MDDKDVGMSLSDMEMLYRKHYEAKHGKQY